MNSASVPPVSRRRVASAFPPDRGFEYELKAIGFSVAFYLMYAATIVGSISPWIFVVAGPFVLIRSFNALHETFHVGGTWLSPLRWLAIVVGPIQFGYDQYRAGHHSHHAHQGDDNDIEAYLVRGGMAHAFLQAFTQPEQALFRYLKHRKLDAKLCVVLAMNFLIFATMVALGWGWNAVLYVAVTRIGNTFTWFTFHWVLHHPALVNGLQRMPMPSWLAAIWWISLGPDSLAGSTHHELHHAYPAVPDSQLPALLSWVSGSNESGTVQPTITDVTAAA